MESNQCTPQSELRRDLVLKMHSFALRLNKEKNFGQTRTADEIEKKFKIKISENTVAGWIYRELVPYDNEKTQFKPKAIPPKKHMKKLYIEKDLSASEIGIRFGVSTVTAIKWLNKHNITARSHTESMNTERIKNELRLSKLKIPKKSFFALTPEKAYVLGVLAGDGYINNEVVRLEIRKDVEFIEEFSRCVEDIYGRGYKHSYYARRNTYVFSASSGIICADLNRYGRFKTFEWKAPNAILHTRNRHIISNYLKGLFDSEGSVSKYDITFSSSSKKGIWDVQALLLKLGIRSKIYQRKNHFVLRIGRRENVHKFKELVGFTIKRKMERIK